jgi:hypothetical protein
MATCLDIITLALRQALVLSPGDDPEDGEADDGLTAMQGMFDGWVSNGMFGRLNDVYKTVNYTALEGDRVRYPATATITIPTTYAENGAEGSERAPRDLSLIETYDTTNSTRSVQLWDRNGWVELTGLTLTSTAPLGDRDKFGLAAALADHYGEMFGASLPPNIARRAQQFRTSLSYKLGSTRDRATAVYF